MVPEVYLVIFRPFSLKSNVTEIMSKAMQLSQLIHNFVRILKIETSFHFKVRNLRYLRVPLRLPF